MKLLRPGTILLVLLLLALPVQGQAQDSAPASSVTPAPGVSPNVFTARVLATDEVNLRAGDRPIRLWGIDPVIAGTALFRLEARTALDNLVGSEAVQCDRKGMNGATIIAQCVNAGDVDLGLFMLQNGFVMADRALVYGSAYEEPYIAAEKQAQARQLGIWANESAQGKGSDAMETARTLLIGAFILLMLFICSFIFLAFVMMKGFRNFMNAQERGNDLMHKERQLKVQERQLVASMLDAELRANKSKIEAYLLIYGEMLKTVKDRTKAPSYTRTGDIVQMQPALDRSVFDRNTDKMDLLGRRLASEVIHFYARIKTNPDYINLEPDTPVDTAREHVERAVANAKRLDDLLVNILDMFGKAGLSRED